jgi:predicted NBD/HSP70 family sugar kinase
MRLWRAEAYMSKHALSARLFELGRDLQFVSCIADAASRGDRVVLKVLQEAGAHLGIALANVVYAVNLRHIVLGGDLAELADYLLPSIRKVLSANVASPSGANIQLHVSALGRDAVAFGGVALAMEGFLPVLPNGISYSSPDRRTQVQGLGKPKRTGSGGGQRPTN